MEKSIRSRRECTNNIIVKENIVVEVVIDPTSVVISARDIIPPSTH